MIIQVTFKCDREKAEGLIGNSGIKTTNEPRCIAEKQDQSVWIIYCSKSAVTRWRYVLHVGRVMNALTKEVYYEGILQTIPNESTVH